MCCQPGHLSLPAAAARLRLNYRTVRSLVRRGALRGARYADTGRWYVEEADVAAYLAARVARSLAALTASPAEKESPP